MATTSTQALTAVKREIDGFTALDTSAARQLLNAADALSGTRELAAALADRGAETAAKQELLGRSVPGMLPAVRRVLDAAVAQRWDNGGDFAAGVQEAAIRAIAQATGATEQLVGELNAFLDVVSTDGELELTLGSRLGTTEAKVELIDRLFSSKLSADTMSVLRSLIRYPNGRRTRRAVQWATDVVADQADRQVATVTVARSLGEEQLARLQAGLATRFGRPVAVNEIVDPSVIGGVRIELGDDVIDDTAVARLKELRLQLA